jgi:hypothetical protein
MAFRLAYPELFTYTGDARLSRINSFMLGYHGRLGSSRTSWGCDIRAPLRDTMTTEMPSLPATVRTDWEMPASPLCKTCSKPIDLVAVNGGDAWYVIWDEECPDAHLFAATDQDHDLLVGDRSWPFVEPTAGYEDWERLGIRTEVG